jgi:hypothetical protein
MKTTQKLGSDLGDGVQTRKRITYVPLKSSRVNEPSCLQGDQGCTFRMQSRLFVGLPSQQTVRKVRNCCGELEACAAVQVPFAILVTAVQPHGL